MEVGRYGLNVDTAQDLDRIVLFPSLNHDYELMRSLQTERNRRIIEKLSQFLLEIKPVNIPMLWVARSTIGSGAVVDHIYRILDLGRGANRTRTRTVGTGRYVVYTRCRCRFDDVSISSGNVFTYLLIYTGLVVIWAWASHALPFPVLWS